LPKKQKLEKTSWISYGKSIWYWTNEPEIIYLSSYLYEIDNELHQILFVFYIPKKICSYLDLLLPGFITQ